MWLGVWFAIWLGSIHGVDACGISAERFLCTSSPLLVDSRAFSTTTEFLVDGVVCECELRLGESKPGYAGAIVVSGRWEPFWAEDSKIPLSGASSLRVT